MLKRSKRWSILPAFTVSGYLSYLIYQGSITATIFNGFIRDQVLPHCGRYEDGDPLSVLVVDNASIHWNSDLVDMLDEAGVLLARLPPYSPDLNPIETSFSVLKAWIKRHQDMAIIYQEGDYGEFLKLAIEAQEGRGDPGHCVNLGFIM